MIKPTKRVLFTASGLILSVIILYYLLTQISLADAWKLITEINGRGLALFFLCSITMSVLRTWRYQILLVLAGHRPSSLLLFLTVLIRNAFADLLPARLGSTVYILICSTRLGIPLSAATSSFALALVFDMIAIAPILILFACFGLRELLTDLQLLLSIGLVGGVSVVILVALPSILEYTAKRIESFRSSSAKRWADEVRSTAADVQQVRRGGKLARVLAISVAIRIAKYSALYCLLYALLTSRGFTFAELPPIRISIGLFAAEVAASLPVASVAGFGVYQGAWFAVFQLLGFSAELAALTSIAHHALTQVYGYSLGLVALLLLFLQSLPINPSPSLSPYPETKEGKD